MGNRLLTDPRSPAIGPPSACGAGLIGCLVALAGSGVYIRIAGLTVNVALSDVLIIPAVLYIVARAGIEKMPLRMNRLIVLTGVLWCTWLGTICISLIQPVVAGYADTGLSVMAFAKPATSALYSLVIPVWAASTEAGVLPTTRLVRIWTVTAAMEVVLNAAPALRTLMSFGGRFCGFFRDPNLYAIYASQAAILSLGLYLKDGARIRSVAGASVVLGTLGVVLSGSRTGFAAYICALVVLLALGRENRRRLLPMLAVAAVAAAVGGRLLRESGGVAVSTARLAAGGYAEGLYSRLETWGYAIQAIRASPLLGVGREHFVRWKAISGIPSVTSAHNAYLGAWAETGLIGFVAFIGLFVLLPLCLSRRLVRDDSRRDPVALALAAAFVPVWVGAAGLNIENYRGNWLVLGLTIVQVIARGRPRGLEDRTAGHCRAHAGSPGAAAELVNSGVQ